MLNRRHIRIKVMQTLFALNQNEITQGNTDQKFLLNSMSHMYDLYLLMMALFIELHKKSEDYFNKLQNRILVDDNDPQPSRCIIDNAIFNKISGNKLLTDTIAKQKINYWDLDFEYVDKIFKQIVKSKIYRKYAELTNYDFQSDKQFVADIFRDIIAPNDKLYDYLEDKKLTWIDDLPIINTNLLKMLKQIKPESDESYFLPDLYKDEDDKQFAIQLYQKSILYKDELNAEIKDKTTNWDSERLAAVDATLLAMAICEFKYFPSIPVKVTINEYLEIAKEYSTPKSSTFINGILDNLVKQYQKTNMLNKTGRGLK